MPQLAYPHPNLPGFAPPKTYAAWPVWSGSTTAEIRFAPVPKERAWYIYRKLREWNRSDAKGRYTGLVGSAALRVAESLLFDFLNFASGRLDPSYEGIAQKTHLGRSTVAVALKRLKQLGVIQWVKRCSNHRAEDGRLERRQETNAYGVLPPSQWRGFVDPNPPAPTPDPSSWGATPPLPDVHEQAAQVLAQGSPKAVLEALELDPTNPVAAALARLGRSIDARLGVHTVDGNLPQI